jgi:hypothetical protein
MKKTGTLSPGLGASLATLKPPPAAIGFTSSGRFQAAELAEPDALAGVLGAALATALLLTTGAVDAGAELAGGAVAATAGTLVAAAEVGGADADGALTLAAELGVGCAWPHAVASSNTPPKALALAAPFIQSFKSSLFLVSCY